MTCGMLKCLLVFMVQLQAHIRVLESTVENRAALLMGLEYLIGISYVEDTRGFQGAVAHRYCLVPCYIMIKVVFGVDYIDETLPLCMCSI
ncbi:hypothetical protein Scep_019485 [Stephania cephalantha]|uniref:Secreted protein n=1 Tax=Stephania cephalantha TaxID=152367 RepID=A0AAP0IAR6_9MAGN